VKLRPWSIPVALVVLAAALAAWLMLSRVDAPARKAAREPASAPHAPSVRGAAPPRTAAEPKLESRPGRTTLSAAARTGHDDDIVGPGPDDPHEPGMHPHPITAEHLRIQAENQLIQKLNDAMAVRDVRAMRALLGEYEKLDPRDIEATQAGYAVIADCVESPGEASLAAARDFYATQRHSALRRFVRRICFENGN